MPEARLDGCLQWSHLSSGHTGANRSADFFRECFYSILTLTELRSHMQTIVDACGCHASKQSDSRDRGLISSSSSRVSLVFRHTSVGTGLHTTSSEPPDPEQHETN